MRLRAFCIAYRADLFKFYTRLDCCLILRVGTREKKKKMLGHCWPAGRRNRRGIAEFRIRDISKSPHPNTYKRGEFSLDEPYLDRVNSPNRL